MGEGGIRGNKGDNKRQQGQNENENENVKDIKS